MNGVVRLGDRALRFQVPSGVSTAAALAALRGAPGVTDAWAGEDSVAIELSTAWPDPAPLLARLHAAASLPPPVPRTHTLRARYDGADLTDVATRLRLGPAEVVARHAREYTVLTIGFAPGFAYLGPLDPALALPRRPTPRPRVPGGALAIAADRTAVYPGGTPGGWWLIGTVEGFTPFDPERGAAFAVGDRVRVVET